MREIRRIPRSVSFESAVRKDHFLKKFFGKVYESRAWNNMTRAFYSEVSRLSCKINNKDSFLAKTV